MNPRQLSAPRVVLAGITTAIYWTHAALFFFVMGLLLLPLRRHSGVQRFGQRWLRQAFRVQVRLLLLFDIVRCEYVGFEPLDHQSDGYIVAPNHPAMWDVVFLLSRLDPMTCIFKASLIRNPMFTGGAVLAGLIPNTPPIRMVKRAVEVLEAGGRVLFFPEGTRTLKHECRVNLLQGSMGLVAKRSHAPVWPVFVTTDSDYLSKGWPVWRLPRMRVHIRMRVGDPIRCGAGESVEDFNERLRDIYLNSIA